MSFKPYIPVWKTAPFIRLVIPLITGIIFQWYCQLPLSFILLLSGCISIAYLLFQFLPLAIKFKLHFIQGIFINILLFCFGLLLTWNKDIRHDSNWYGHYYKDSAYLVVKIDEPLVVKAKSYKVEGYVEAIMKNDAIIPCKGKILLYFSKDSIAPLLIYGDRIMLNKPLQQIKNSGNPGAFNYERYAAFQQTFHNIFLKDKDWIKFDETNINWFNQFIYSAKAKILSALQKNIQGNDNELGVAEALLIGYKEDLDKDLVQAYSNTGVVHIIAISGLHLGLIYIMLVWICRRMPLLNKSKLLTAIIILGSLWLFSLLTGASASVLRSAVMFTCIVIGESFFKRASIYNSLAASAFLLLCFNPYFLWDVGFQLSYFAVISIIIFQRPIYNWMYVKNKWIDKVWQLVAVSLAAQILTFPVCIYYFHQFPNFFLLTNIVAVPLSSIILFAEIFLVVFAWIPFAGEYLGKLISWLVWLMNKTILLVNDLPFALWDRISADLLSTFLLYAIVFLFAGWLLQKNKALFRLGLIVCLVFSIQYAYTQWQFQHQEKLIVYNVPKYRAIDFVDGNNYQFVGDSVLLQDGLLQNFHLKPGRIKMQLNKQLDSVNNVFMWPPFYQIGDQTILLIDKSMKFEKISEQK